MNRRTVIYKGKPYFVIEDGGSGLIRIAQGEEVNRFGEHCWSGDVRYVESDEVSMPPKHWDRVETEKNIDSNCEFCSDPIFEGEGRRRIGGKDYHHDSQSDCFMESVKLKSESERVIQKCAESMLYDKRITA